MFWLLVEWLILISSIVGNQWQNSVGLLWNISKHGLEMVVRKLNKRITHLVNSISEFNSSCTKCTGRTLHPFCRNIFHKPLFGTHLADSFYTRGSSGIFCSYGMFTMSAILCNSIQRSFIRIDFLKPFL